LTYDWRRPNELACVAFMQTKMEEIGRAMGGSLIWRAPVSPAGAPGAHHEGGTVWAAIPEVRWQPLLATELRWVRQRFRIFEWMRSIEVNQ
jgi:hypothetical protein